MQASPDRLADGKSNDKSDEMELHDEPISVQVNAAIESAIDGRRRRRNLFRFLDALDAEHGPSDPADLAEFRQLFS